MKSGTPCQKCEHQQSHIDFLKNDYLVSLFSRNNLLAKTYFLWNPNFLLLHISFFFSVNQHRYNHDHFSKISRSFCARSILRPEKKSFSRLSGGCAIVIMTKKKSSSRLSGGCAITTISTTGPIYAKSSDFYAKLNVSNLNVTNLY